MTDNESISSAVKDSNPNELDKFIVVSKYGKIYLDSDEFRKCYRKTANRYFRFLGESVFHFTGKEFWKYHKVGLSESGFKLNRPKLAKYICLTLLDLIFNPKKTLGSMIRAYRR